MDIPRHIAIIMDGNGRWAKKRGLPRHLGHKSGLDAVRKIIEACAGKGVETLTLFAFSSENWRRPENEVSFLMQLFVHAIQGEAARLHENNIRLRVIGDTSAFTDKLRKSIESIESLTAENSGLLVQIAANYGGRWDITEAVRKLAADAKDGRLNPEDIDEDLVSRHLSFWDQDKLVDDPDLLIRTGGENRISNFLLWQCAYSEFYFTDTLWPDFSPAALDEALIDFAGRQRRFGCTGDQVENTAEGTGS